MKYCTNCGSSLNYKNAYCDNCGQKLDANKRQAENLLAKTYRITGSISILMGVIGFISGMVNNFSKEKIIPDVVGALIYNFPRLYFGYTLQHKGINDPNYALKISLGMTIYSTLLVILNFIISSNGWLYIILTFLYFRSYKMTKEMIINK